MKEATETRIVASISCAGCLFYAIVAAAIIVVAVHFAEKYW